MRFAMLPLIAVVGCATAPVKETPYQLSKRLGSPTLCYVHYAGSVSDKQLVSTELGLRGFVCTEQDIRDGERYWNAIQSEQAQMAAQSQAENALSKARALELGLQLLTPPPPRPMVQCHTDRFGNTTCW